MIWAACPLSLTTKRRRGRSSGSEREDRHRHRRRHRYRAGDVAEACGARGQCRCELPGQPRSEEHTSELQSLMRISYAVFCLKKKTNKKKQQITLKTPTELRTQ